MSRTPHLFTSLLLLATVTIAGPAPAADLHSTPTLFSVAELSSRAAQTFDSGYEDSVQDAVEEWLIALDPAVVAANPATLRIDLPYGPELEALRTDFVDYGPGWKSWFGKVRHAGVREAASGLLYLGYHGSRVTAILHFEGERYQIVGGVGGPQRLVRQSDELAEAPTCGLHTPDDARSEEPAEEPAAADLLAAAPATKALTRIDVMAVYPKSYFSFPTSQITLVDFVEDSIALANQAFTNSNVNAYYNLVHVGPIVGTQPSANSLQAALDLLNSGASEINTLRSAFGADFVTFFVPYGWTGTNACGVANLPVIRNSTGLHDYVAGVDPNFHGTTLSTRLYSANRQSCGFGDYTLAHEFGHNWGMWHSNIPTGTWSLLSANALGYEFTASGPRATVMGCNCSSGCTPSPSAVCNRVGHFSDPAINFMGVPTGTNATMSHPGTKNAQMARSRLLSYPNFYPQSSNTPPVASFTISCNSSTRVCTFNASGTTDNGTITKYYWNFGDGTSQTTTTPTVNHTYGGSGTSYWVHLLATDNGNQRDLAIDLVSL